MPLELQKRQHVQIGDTIRRVEASPTGSPRILRQSYPSHGVDFGVAIVPRTDIPKATRPGGSGTEFCPGKGTAYLFKIDGATDCVVPWLDSDGNVIFKDVYNLSTTQEYQPNDLTFLLESGSIYELEDDTAFELEGGGTDLIGLSTPVLFASMDRAGRLFLPRAEGDVDVQFTIEGFSGSDGSAILLNQETLQIVGDRDAAPSTLGNIIDVAISDIVAGVKVDISAAGDLFNFVDNDQFPPFNTEPVALGESIVVESVIDPAQLEFATIRVSPSKITHHFGQVFGLSGDTGLAGAFPSDDILIQGGGTVSVDVNKVLDQIIITITNSTPNPASAASPSQSGAFPIGAIIESVKDPIDIGKLYIDRDGEADIDWCYMDGTSNANPGSGKDMRNRSQYCFFEKVA